MKNLIAWLNYLIRIVEGNTYLQWICLIALMLWAMMAIIGQFHFIREYRQLKKDINQLKNQSTNTGIAIIAQKMVTPIDTVERQFAPFTSSLASEAKAFDFSASASASRAIRFASPAWQTASSQALVCRRMCSSCSCCRNSRLSSERYLRPFLDKPIRGSGVPPNAAAIACCGSLLYAKHCFFSSL